MEHVFYFFFRQFPMWFARIALVFHNGFCRVRFPTMEQVFFMFLPLPCCVMQQVGVSAKKKIQEIPDFYFKKKYYNWVVFRGRFTNCGGFVRQVYQLRWLCKAAYI